MRGNFSAKEILRSHLGGADGVVPEAKNRKNAFVKHFGSGTTPSTPLGMLRDISLVVATPPNLGGDALTENLSSQLAGI